MELETLIYEKGDRIATMTLNRPERGNDTRVLVVKSNGKNFCTGYDLTEWGYLWGSGEPSRPEDSRPHRRAPRTFFTDERAGFVSGQVLYFAGGPHG